MALSNLLALRNSILGSVFSPEMLALYENQKKLKHILGVSDFVQVHKETIEAMTPGIEATLTSHGTHVIQSAIFGKMIDFKSLLDQSQILKYASLFATLGIPYTPLPQHSDSESTPIFLEAEYDLLYLPDTDIEEEALTNKEESIIIDESERIRKIILDVYRKNIHLLQLHPREFEEMVAELLRHSGCEVELTKQTRDGGCDIIAIKNVNSHKQRWLVECKRHKEANKVTVGIVRAFKEVVQSQNANLGIIATTSYFTKDALKKQAETPWLLDFRDKDAVMEWVFEYAAGFRQ